MNHLSQPGPIEHVYHVTLTDRLTCLDEGLKPCPPKIKSEWRSALDQRYDKVCPENLRSAGITRSGAVYAHPDADIAHSIHNKNTLSTWPGRRRLATIAIGVNPTEAYVCDAFLLSEGYAPPSKYWESAITLKTFRENYLVDVSEYGLEVVKTGDDRSLLGTYIEPEVLVPGPIDASRLSWYSSSARTIPDDIQW